MIVDGTDPTTPDVLYDQDSGGQRARDINGKRVLQVPESKSSAWISYGLPLNDNGRIDFLANYSYISDVYYSAYELELDRAPEYDRIDLRATWTSADEGWIVLSLHKVSRTLIHRCCRV